MKNKIVRFSLITVFVSLGFASLAIEHHAQTVSTAGSIECEVPDYRHKSDDELSVMTPQQLIEEGVREQLYHMPSFDEYAGAMINKYLRKHHSVAVLPVVTKHIADYDPASGDRCQSLRLFVSVAEASGRDRGSIRLRGLAEGKLLIAALEQAVDRMRKAGDGNEANSLTSRVDLYTLQLKALKGTNERDEIIRSTLRHRHDVDLSDAELLEFSNFLISIDPEYPTWSGIADPLKMLLEDSQKYYRAYQKYKSKRQSVGLSKG